MASQGEMLAEEWFRDQPPLICSRRKKYSVQSLGLFVRKTPNSSCESAPADMLAGRSEEIQRKRERKLKKQKESTRKLRNLYYQCRLRIRQGWGLSVKLEPKAENEEINGLTAAPFLRIFHIQNW